MDRQSDISGTVAQPAAPLVGRSRGMVLLAFGWINVACGVIGLFLPVWPTTIFLLMAAWAFSKSSPRFHGWLINHRVLGPPVVNWQQRGVIPRACKVLAVAMMSLSVAVVALATSAPGYVPVLMAAILVPVALFVATRPER